MSAFEKSLLGFSDSHTKDLLGMNVQVVSGETESSHRAITTQQNIATTKKTLSLFDFQKICSVLCAYRFFEVISLHAECTARISTSSPTPYMFLPDSPGAKETLHVSQRHMYFPIY